MEMEQRPETAEGHQGKAEGFGVHGCAAAEARFVGVVFEPSEDGEGHANCLE